MHPYIAVQNTYEVFEMALFINNTLHDQVSEDKRHTSKLFVPLLQQLLSKNNISFANISFCAVNCGPGPFSTLRSIIASVNGLHCATEIPLIGIDGLNATFLEFYDKSYEHTVVLLNAFNDEVYYLIAHHDVYSINSDSSRARPEPVEGPSALFCNKFRMSAKDLIIATGYKKIDAFLEDLKKQIPHQKINFFGNGVMLHQEQIKSTLGEKAILNQDGKNMCSVEQIGKIGLEMFEKNNFTNNYLMPLHLKKHPVELL